MNSYSLYAYVFDTSLQKTLYTYCSDTGKGGRRQLFDAEKSSTYGNVTASGYPFDIIDFAYLVRCFVCLQETSRAIQDYCGSSNIKSPEGDVAMDKVQVGLRMAVEFAPHNVARFVEV